MGVVKQKIKSLFLAIVGKEYGENKILQFKIKRNVHRNLRNGSLGIIRKTIRLDHRWYGKMQEGFFVYEKMLNKNAIVYSFGVGFDISFENELTKKFDCQVYAFDPTPKSINWLQKQGLPKNFHFFDYGLGKKDEKVVFYLPQNEDHVSGSIVTSDHVNEQNFIEVPMKSFTTIIDNLNHSKIDILKMDIEGSEYEVLQDIISSPIVIDQILVEFHARYFNDGVKKTNELIDFIINNGYEIFGVSASMEEVSFIRKDCVKSQ